MAKAPAPMSLSDVYLPISVSGVEIEPRRDIKDDGDRWGEEAKGKPIRRNSVSSTISGFEVDDIGSRDPCSSDESSRPLTSYRGGGDVPGVNTSPAMQRSTAPFSSSITDNEETQGDEKCKVAGQRDQAKSTLKQERSTLSPPSCSPPNAARGTTNGTADIDSKVLLAPSRMTVDSTKCMALASVASGDPQSGMVGYRVVESQAYESCGIKRTPLYRSCHGDSSEEHDNVDIFPEDCQSLDGNTTARSSLGNVRQNKPDQDLVKLNLVRKRER